MHEDGSVTDGLVSNRLWFASMVAGTTVFGTIALTAPFVLSRSPLPYMATPSRKVRRALEYLKQNGHSCCTFVDLGSGDGEAVYQATQVGYQRAIGIELNYTLALLAKFRRRFFWTADQRSRSMFLTNDLFQYNLQSADTVMIFGVKPLMLQLSQKLNRECRPGTHVLSYRFQLPYVTADRAKGADDDLLLTAEIVYDEEEMTIYRIAAKYE
jgi:Histone methylation protein DOT1